MLPKTTHNTSGICDLGSSLEGLLGAQKDLKNSTSKSRILVVGCFKKCFKMSFKNRGCENAISSDFVKHSSNFGLRGVVFKAFLEDSFWANCAQNLVIYSVFDMFDIDFVQKPWFLQHSVGGRPLQPGGRYQTDI